MQFTVRGLDRADMVNRIQVEYSVVVQKGAVQALGLMTCPVVYKAINHLLILFQSPIALPSD